MPVSGPRFWNASVSRAWKLRPTSPVHRSSPCARAYRTGCPGSPSTPRASAIVDSSGRQSTAQPGVQPATGARPARGIHYRVCGLPFAFRVTTRSIRRGQATTVLLECASNVSEEADQHPGLRDPTPIHLSTYHRSLLEQPRSSTFPHVEAHGALSQAGISRAGADEHLDDFLLDLLSVQGADDVPFDFVRAIKAATPSVTKAPHFERQARAATRSCPRGATEVTSSFCSLADRSGLAPRFARSSPMTLRRNAMPFSIAPRSFISASETVEIVVDWYIGARSKRREICREIVN